MSLEHDPCLVLKLPLSIMYDTCSHLYGKKDIQNSLPDRNSLFMKRKIPITLSRFFGVIISMHYNDSSPPPHFHVHYDNQNAIIDIQSLTILQGKLTPRLRGLITEWAALHQNELFRNWELAQKNAPLEKIKPLE
jgi:Domain of unknown function (DUF4160)